MTTGTIFTDQLFTGQREMTGLGIYHYNARFYSPKLGRFLSADTIVPNPANPQDLNRFSYVRNSPLRYTDPTGHKCVSAGPGDCLNDNGKPINGAGTPVNGNNNNEDDGGIITPTPVVTPSIATTPPVTSTGTPPPFTQSSTSPDINVPQLVGGAILTVGGMGFLALGAAMIGFAVVETAVVTVIPTPIDDLLLLGHRGAAVGMGLVYMYFGVNAVIIGYGEMKDALIP